MTALAVVRNARELTPLDRLSLVMPWVSPSSQEELRRVRDAMVALVEATRQQQSGQFKCPCKECIRVRAALAEFDAPMPNPVSQSTGD